MNENNKTENTAPLSLQGLVPFGIGGRRLCFTHPLDKTKCIKVLRQDDQRTIRIAKRRIIPARFHRTYNNNLHEKYVLDNLYRTLGSKMGEHLPLSYGMIPTDLGPGLVLDLMRDIDGKISRSLRELMSTGHELHQFSEAFEEFGDFLEKNVILTRNLLDHNLVVKHLGGENWKMYLIDGLGDPAWLPFASWFKSVGRAKVRKRVQTAWPRFERFASQGGVTKEMIERSSWGQGILKHRE